MNDTPNNNWGPFGTISVLIGIASWQIVIKEGEQ